MDDLTNTVSIKILKKYRSEHKINAFNWLLFYFDLLNHGSLDADEDGQLNDSFGRRLGMLQNENSRILSIQDFWMLSFVWPWSQIIKRNDSLNIQKYCALPLSHIKAAFQFREMISLFLLIFAFQKGLATDQVTLNDLQMTVNGMNDKINKLEVQVQDLQSEVKERIILVTDFFSHNYLGDNFEICLQHPSPTPL